MTERWRSVAQRLKGVSERAISETQKHRLHEIKSNATAKVVDATRQRGEQLSQRIRDVFAQYEKFTGVQEVMMLQNSVVGAQERFMAAQDKRRELGRSVAALEMRLKELHAEMQNTMKGDEKYLHLCTEEHKLILQERSLRQQFSDAEREERERFAEMSAAVKVGHERERAHAERTKYWYIVASILGTVLGIAGSTVNNRIKMNEFRNMMERQMARSAGVLYNVAGGQTSSIEEGLRSELQYQEQLANSVKLMQETVSTLVQKQTSLIDHMNHQEHNIDVQLKELRKLVAAAARTSSTFDAELVKGLATVHHDLEETHTHDAELPKNRIVLEPTQVITGVGVVTCMALIIGSILGKLG